MILGIIFIVFVYNALLTRDSVDSVLVQIVPV